MAPAVHPLAPIPVFATTRWTLVLRASHEGSPHHANALAQFCSVCWHPLYAFARRPGPSPPDAQDLTQSFFARLLERNYQDHAGDFPRDKH